MSGMVSLWGASSLIRSVQYGTVALSGVTTNTATIVAVDTSRAVVIDLCASNNWSGGTSEAYAVPRFTLTNSTTVTAVRGAVGGIDCNAAFAVVEFAPGVLRSVQTGTITPTAGAVTATITDVNVAKAVVLSLGVSGDNGGVGGSWWSRLTLSSSTTVTATRQDTSAAAMPHNFAVMEFF